jgi:hypothetical protein
MLCVSVVDNIGFELERAVNPDRQSAEERVIMDLANKLRMF